MRLEGESYGIDVGSFVMNYHHGLLRMGVVESKRKDDQGWTCFTVNFFEDDIHKAAVDWDKKLNVKKARTNEFRGEYLKPVSVQWLKNVMDAHGRYEDERRTEIG
jgi:hypothetical protein